MVQWQRMPVADNACEMFASDVKYSCHFHSAFSFGLPAVVCPMINHEISEQTMGNSG